MAKQEYTLQFTRRKGRGEYVHWELRVANIPANAAIRHSLDGDSTTYKYATEQEAAGYKNRTPICDDNICSLTMQQVNGVRKLAEEAEITRSTTEGEPAMRDGKYWSCQRWTLGIIQDLETEGIVPEGVSTQIESRLNETHVGDYMTWRVHVK